MCTSALSAISLGALGACGTPPSAETLTLLTEAEDPRLVDVVVEDVRRLGDGSWEFEGRARLAADLHGNLHAAEQAALCGVAFGDVPPWPRVVRLAATAGTEARIAYGAVLDDEPAEGGGPASALPGRSLERDGAPVHGFPRESWEAPTVVLGTAAEERACCASLR